MIESEDLRVVELRTALNTEWQRSTYDGYHGPAHVRHAAWLRLLEKIDAYADARAAAAAAAPAEPEQPAEPDPEVTLTTEDDTSTIEVSTPSQPAKPRRTSSRRSTR